MEDCVKILLSCSRNLESELKDIRKLGLSKYNNQIKGKKELVDLSESIKFMSDKLDEFQKERKEQKNVIEELRGELCSLNKKRNCITEQVDRQEQYSKQNLLLIHRITVEKGQTQML